jgi:hypothetical protein
VAGAVTINASATRRSRIARRAVKDQGVPVRRGGAAE